MSFEEGIAIQCMILIKEAIGSHLKLELKKKCTACSNTAKSITLTATGLNIKLNSRPSIEGSTTKFKNLETK